MKIGRLKLANNVIAAPLAGYSDAVWRVLVAELGAGMVFSEMVSAEGLTRAPKRNTRYVKNPPKARPFAVQLFGPRPESYKSAFDVLKNFEFDAVDVNAGCPVKKVVSRGGGAALMKTPKTIEAILKNVRQVFDGPLTLKIRSGWDETSINAVEIAKIAEDCGADAIIVHPRTRMQVFTGQADWKIIAQVKAAVKIPVIGNGDVTDKASALRMFSETGCDAIMVGRTAIGNPWIFREICGGAIPTPEEKSALIRYHFELAKKEGDERYTMNVIRKFLPKYLKGLPGCREIIKKILPSKTVEEMMDKLEVLDWGITASLEQ